MEEQIVLLAHEFRDEGSLFLPLFICDYRYHPLLLNAAFLGDLTPEDSRILGFGNKTHYQPNYVRESGHRGFQRFMTAAYVSKMWLGEWTSRVVGKVGRMVRLK